MSRYLDELRRELGYGDGANRSLAACMARVAGLMYLVTLAVDITGLQMDADNIGGALAFAGALCVIPLSPGLYYALRPAGAFLAGSALGFRLVEVGLGFLTTTFGFAGVHQRLAGSGAGTELLHLGQWASAAYLSALVFTIGSTIFFYLFVRSGYVPRLLVWWGLIASVVALAACGTHLLHPAFPAMTMSVWVPALIAEMSTGLWLLIRSIRVETYR